MPFQATSCPIADALMLEPKVFGDSRGYFFESFNQRDFDACVGKHVPFVQDNQSKSGNGVLRGLHYQIEHAQGKLVRALSGTVYDVIVDLRRSSPSYRQWFGIELSAENRKQLWAPPGLAHGFLVTSDFAEFSYKTTDYWHPEFERTVRWDDSTLKINWPAVGKLTIASKDLSGRSLGDAETYA